MAIFNTGSADSHSAHGYYINRRGRGQNYDSWLLNPGNVHGLTFSVLFLDLYKVYHVVLRIRRSS